MNYTFISINWKDLEHKDSAYGGLIDGRLRQAKPERTADGKTAGINRPLVASEQSRANQDLADAISRRASQALVLNGTARKN